MEMEIQFLIFNKRKEMKMKLFIIIGNKCNDCVAQVLWSSRFLENKLSAKYLDIWEKATTSNVSRTRLILIGIVSLTTANLNIAVG